MELKVKDFESALKSLEDIVAQLEGGNLSLDQSLELFEEGIRISRFCSSKLEEAERRVEVLTKTANGELKEEPFSEENIFAALEDKVKAGMRTNILEKGQRLGGRGLRLRDVRGLVSGHERALAGDFGDRGQAGLAGSHVLGPSGRVDDRRHQGNSYDGHGPETPGSHANPL